MQAEIRLLCPVDGASMRWLDSGNGEPLQPVPHKENEHKLAAFISGASSTPIEVKIPVDEIEINGDRKIEIKADPTPLAKARAEVRFSDEDR